MKRKGIFPGMLLVGVGLFFLLQQWNVPFMTQLLSWPSILLIIGLAFLFQSYLGNDTQYLFSGWLLAGLGVHFHGNYLITNWPTHWSMYTFIVGGAFLMQYNKTKRDGLLAGICFIILSLLGLFYTSFMETFQSFFHLIEGFWPIVLIIIGLYLLVKRK